MNQIENKALEDAIRKSIESNESVLLWIILFQDWFFGGHTDHPQDEK